eukprot:1159571-Pelagomonas_calceolata.AAC.6
MGWFHMLAMRLRHGISVDSPYMLVMRQKLKVGMSVAPYAGDEAEVWPNGDSPDMLAMRQNIQVRMSVAHYAGEEAEAWHGVMTCPACLC